MEFQDHRRSVAPRGGAAIVILNVIVLLLIVGLGGGYYFIQMRPQRAVGAFSEARDFERKGHLSSAEIFYRKAVHLDPGNIHYQRSLDALLNGEGNLKEMEKEAEAKSEKARAASAALFPEDTRMSSTPSLAGIPKKEEPADPTPAPPPLPTVEKKPVASKKTEPKMEVAAVSAPKVNTIASAPPAAAMIRRNVDIEIVAPGNAEFEIRAVNVEDEIPGRVMQPWAPVEPRVQRVLRPGKYEIAVRAPWAEPVVELFAVPVDGKVLQSVKLELGVLKIGGEPATVKIYENGSDKVIGQTPYVALKRPGPVAYTLKAAGHEDSLVEGEVEARGVLHFNHRLAKMAPPPTPAPVAIPKSKPEPKPVVMPKPEPKPVTIPAAVAVAPSVTPTPAPKLAAVAAPVAIPIVAPVALETPASERPVIGQPFVGAGGVEYIFGAKSNRGDPFWMSKSAPLAGRSKAAAHEHCAALTAREREAGRVPASYGYFPSLAGDGRIALCVEYVAGGDGAVRKVKQEVLPTRKPLVLSPAPAPVRVTEEYRDHVASGSAVSFGSSFLNGDRIWMEYGPKDSYGNPFWMSATGIVMGMSTTRANQFCWDLTKRERAGGRVPGDYRYLPVQGGSGKVILGRTAPGGAR